MRAQTDRLTAPPLRKRSLVASSPRSFKQARSVQSSPAPVHDLRKEATVIVSAKSTSNVRHAEGLVQRTVLEPSVEQDSAPAGHLRTALESSVEPQESALVGLVRRTALEPMRVAQAEFVQRNAFEPSAVSKRGRFCKTSGFCDVLVRSGNSHAPCIAPGYPVTGKFVLRVNRLRVNRRNLWNTHQYAHQPEKTCSEEISA